MAYVFTEIDLREVDANDLIEELQSRYLDDRHRAELIDLLKGEEKTKLDLFFKVKDRYSLLELQELFQEKSVSLPTPKEQLPLFINDKT